ncbi:MAG TPA: methylenetetrahydrofolate reductase [Steroidobacteraceae bacterium]|nr:methylenetetrahydrofolate reductase [Steroidobacteraceae bacterium]
MRTLAEKIKNGDCVVTAELTPPKGTDLSEVFAKAEFLSHWVDAVNLTESPRALMTIAPTAVARLLLERNVESIVQMTARDRNRIAIQADLLGAAVLGVRNFVFMGGDSPAKGDHPDAKPVFDLTASQMVAAARELTLGRDMSGKPLRGVPELFIGATVNPGAVDLQAEIVNTRRKIDAGAQFLQTQAIFDAAKLEKFLDAVKPQGVAILGGIIPLKSAKMATWLNEKLPGIHVPEALRRQLEQASGLEAELETGIEIAARTIRDVAQLCDGIHVMALGWETHIPAMLRRGGVRP